MSNSTPNINSAEPLPTPLPLRSAMKQDDDGERTLDINMASSTKVVQIAEPQPEPVSPEENTHKRQFPARLSKRLSGRSPGSVAGPSRPPLLNQTSLEALNNLSRAINPQQPQDDSPSSHPPHRHRIDALGERIIAQVAEWLDHERIKRRDRKAGKKTSHRKEDMESLEIQSAAMGRRFSVDSHSSEVSLDRLQKIIDDSMTSLGLAPVAHNSPRLGRRSYRRRSIGLQRAASSDTDFHDGDVLVPSCDGILDNSKALSYKGGNAEGEEDPTLLKEKVRKERKAWLEFKCEILRLTHTLHLKGWRRVPLDGAHAISVERLSGAMTNAVYAVHPPEDLANKVESGKKNPTKLLLRVYGPNVEHIIDRETELGVLRRLARKKIGPRLLGTFANGRFEQFLNAVTLTAPDLRDANISKKIAKRVRELHDGMELLEDERNGGPAVLKNWDHWVTRVSQVASFLDAKLLAREPGSKLHAADAWQEFGFVCGADWATFKTTYDKYRQLLFDRYGGSKVIREHLVFCHNDTQYGNILRIQPDDKKSPLLQPNYEHKQLVVIDFEYAGANVRGHEFANQFSEWCYDYNDAERSYACNVNRYPTPEEQYEWVKSYVNHRPEHPHPGAATPVLTPLSTPMVGPTTPSLGHHTAGSISSIGEFMLDSRVPPCGWKEEEKRQKDLAEEQIRSLIEETRLWRPMCSAMWTAWGIMQAKIPDFEPQETGEEDQSSEAAVASAPEEEEEAASDFDYLRYSQERAMFFWGDCVTLGLVKLEDLPETLRTNIKLIQR